MSCLSLILKLGKDYLCLRAVFTAREHG